MSAEVRISVLMGTYNPYQKQVEAAIESVLNQTCTDFEFIICDDGSSEAFFQWLARWCKKDARIRLLRNEKNRGLAYTLNRCLRLVHGKYVARMDADDVAKSYRLEKQAAFLDAHSEYAMAGSGAELIDERGSWGIRMPAEQPGRKDFLYTSPFIHPSIMVRTGVLRELHGYSMARYALRTEDYELFMRLYAAGYQGYNFQEALILYREDMASYTKRKYRYRINEAVVRYRGFGMLRIRRRNMRYVVKPLIAGLIPACFMRKIRARQFGDKGR